MHPHSGPLFALAILALISSCQRRSPAADPAKTFRSSASGGEWVLVELHGQPAPMGAGGRPATLRFEADSARAGGFAGCNRYGGSYRLHGDSLDFAPLIMTKMACSEGMDLEQRFAQALEQTRRYELSAAGLTLHGDTTKVARFERRP